MRAHLPCRLVVFFNTSVIIEHTQGKGEVRVGKGGEVKGSKEQGKKKTRKKTREKTD